MRWTLCVGCYVIVEKDTMKDIISSSQCHQKASTRIMKHLRIDTNQSSFYEFRQHKNLSLLYKQKKNTKTIIQFNQNR